MTRKATTNSGARKSPGKKTVVGRTTRRKSSSSKKANSGRANTSKKSVGASGVAKNNAARKSATTKTKRAGKPSNKATKAVLAEERLASHFESYPMENIVTATRKFPVTTRADLQLALEQMFSQRFEALPLGLYQHYSYNNITFSSLLDVERNPAYIGPLQYDEVDIGDEMPARCLKNAFWLAHEGDLPFVALVATSDRYGMDEGVSLEIAVPAGESGLELSRSFLKELESLVSKSSSYRGKVISLEQSSRYSGQSGTIRVHKLHSVTRDQVVLPAKTLETLERNVVEFIAHRESLRDLGMQIKKGLLFYGSPGTGKTHTIHYLASQLPDHTTLLITADQVGLLDEYFLLARFMQPAMIVIEDADLIGRDREKMNSPCEESLLNKLLNEMDGLRADAAILFVLTTNRPEMLEAALASRPGRIDQAIEFPLPDEDGRRKLVHLYSAGLKVNGDVEQVIVSRTEGASPAFIKELLRRAAQFLLQDGGHRTLERTHLDQALDEMLFAGGQLKVKLLGGRAPEERK